MDRIRPPEVPSFLVRENKIIETTAVSELGIYSSFICNGNEFSQGARAHERKEREVHKGGHGRGGAPGSLDEEISRVLKKSGGKAEEALRIAQEDEEPYAEGEAEDDAEDAHAAEATGTEPLENGSLDASAPSSATPGESVP